MTKTLVCAEDKVVDDVFDYVDTSNSDMTTMIHGLRYGEILFGSNPASQVDITGCTIQWGSTTPYYYRTITFPSNHGLQVGNYVQVSNAAVSDYNGKYCVYAIVSDTVVRVFSPYVVLSISTCTVSILKYSEEATKEDNPRGTIKGIRLPYIGNKQDDTVGTEYNVIGVYQKPGFPGSIYFRTDADMGIFGNTSYFTKMTNTDYNAHTINQPYGSNGTITQATPGTAIRITLTSALPFSLGTIPVRIVNSTQGYDGNYTAILEDSTHITIPSVYWTANDTCYVVGTSLLTCAFSYTATDTGKLYVNERQYENPNVYESIDAGFLYYFPVQNYTDWGKVRIWYYDYIGQKWCDFHANNLSNVNVGFIRSYAIDAGEVRGLYLQIRNQDAIYNQQQSLLAVAQEYKWDSYNSWSKYLNGTGGYFNSTEPNPQLCIEFAYSSISVNSLYYNSIPSAILYEILTSDRLCNLPSTMLDWKTFVAGSLDTTYSWDAVTSFFLNSGSYSNCARMNVVVDKSTSIMSILEDIVYKAGLIIYASSIRSTDRRLKLMINKDYDHATQNPPAQLTFSTEDSVSKLVIDHNSDNLTNKILLQRFVQMHYYGRNGYFTNVVKTEVATLYKELTIGSETPMSWWLDNTLGNATAKISEVAQNYLNKYSTAWETCSIELDLKGIVIEPADYIKIYDHKADEYIVVQVYDWKLDLDNGKVSITGKKEFSSKD